jgi:hypothetical protein
MIISLQFIFLAGSLFQVGMPRLFLLPVNSLAPTCLSAVVSYFVSMFDPISCSGRTQRPPRSSAARNRCRRAKLPPYVRHVYPVHYVDYVRNCGRIRPSNCPPAHLRYAPATPAVRAGRRCVVPALPPGAFTQRKRTERSGCSTYTAESFILHTVLKGADLWRGIP